MDVSFLTAALKQRASQLGFDLAETAPVPNVEFDFSHLERWLDQGCAGEMNTSVSSRLQLKLSAVVGETVSFSVYDTATTGGKLINSSGTLAAAATDMHQKGLLEELAEEEKRHYWLLHNIVEHVGRPDFGWIEFAEWHHGEEY